MSEDNLQQRVPSTSSGAIRARAHRERRRKGLRSVRIELAQNEIDTLVEKGYLDPEARNSLTSIGLAATMYIVDFMADETAGLVARRNSAN